MLKIKLNNNIIEVEENSTIAAILKSVNLELYHQACCAIVDGNLVDLREELVKNCDVQILTFADIKGKQTFWHTTAHIFAQAVSELYTDVKFGIGPAVENGFYYDIDLTEQLTTDDLIKIENKMNQIIKQNIKIEKQKLTVDDAIQYMQKINQPYKIELLEQLKQDSIADVSFYKQGNFVDLCRGPHLISTGQVKAIKLISLTGAYWKGDAKNKMLQRIYGISFPDQNSLQQHLTMLEEAKKRDHRRLGKDLELFCFMEAGLGFPFFLPKGMIIKNELINYWRKIHQNAGYLEISTPTILSRTLWEQSGHWAHYKSNMYTTQIDEKDFAIKPMNCPGAVLVYAQKSHSYKELPIRLGEFGLVHRHELSGTLHGLMRARCFTQDDAHIFLTEDQIQDEVKRIINLIDLMYSRFKFNYSIDLSTMPVDHIGTQADWDRATDSLKAAMENLKLNYRINEGDGAFYGPKLDFHIKDCLQRSWQCGTVQLDFQLPQRFNLEYVDRNGEKKQPILIHRVVYGSIERFIGILTEHFGGAFPVWLAPVQVKVLPISEKFENFANGIVERLQKEDIRCEIDNRSEKINNKIFKAQTEKVPFMIILGAKEQESGRLSVRKFSDTETIDLTIDEFIAKVKCD